MQTLGDVIAMLLRTGKIATPPIVVVVQDVTVDENDDELLPIPVSTPFAVTDDEGNETTFYLEVDSTDEDKDD